MSVEVICIAGADDFLPVLIYVVIHANPPQLASNLEYIQRFRMHSRMASESAYFFTQLVHTAYAPAVLLLNDQNMRFRHHQVLQCKNCSALALLAYKKGGVILLTLSNCCPAVFSSVLHRDCKCELPHN